MPSSTSSSEAHGWARAWLAGLLIAALLLAGWETLWRLRGFAPAPNNDMDLWAIERDRASVAGPAGVFLIGSSRIQVGIDARTFAEATGWSTPVQLAIPMGPALPVLLDLAADPSVSGTVVMAVNPQLFFDAERHMDFIPSRHIRRRAQMTPAERIETRLRMLLQCVSVTGNPALYPGRIRDAIRFGVWPVRNHVQIDTRRFGRADFERIPDLREFLRHRDRRFRGWRGRPARPDELARVISRVNRAIARLRKRGGEIAFVRMPTTDTVRAREERIFPRSSYWDVFARRVHGRAIHFEDYPSLNRFHPPDGSHLDQREVVAFSRALGEVLVSQRGAREP